MFPQISMGFFLSYTVWRINKVSIYLSICKIKIKFPNFILHSFEKPIMLHKRWSFHAVVLDCHATVCSLTRGRAADENGLILNDHINQYNMTNSRLCKTVRNRFQNLRLRDSKSPESETSRTTKNSSEISRLSQNFPRNHPIPLHHKFV